MEKEKKKLNLKIPLSFSYENKFVNITPIEICLNIELNEGVNTFSSEKLVVGELMNSISSELECSLTFYYEFYRDENLLVFCGEDLFSMDSTYISLNPRDSEQFSRVYAHKDLNKLNVHNPNWNYGNQFTPGLEDTLYRSVCFANRTIIESAIEQGFTVIERKPLPEMKDEDYLSLSPVYFKGKFLEFYDSSKDYSDDHIIHHFGSIFWGTITLQKGENFANVIGSSNDRKVASKSWIQLWADQFGNPQTCASLDYNGFDCHGYIIGGHSILGKTAQVVKKGSNAVFIIPICTNHNNNDNVYMAALKYTKGVALHNYLQ